MKNGVADSPRGGEHSPPTSREGSGPTPGRGAPAESFPSIDPMELLRTARTLFDNRLGWSEGRSPYAPPELWARLGAVLYGEHDSRVVELRAGALAGPESAAEHLRNALMLLDVLPAYVPLGSLGGQELVGDLTAVRARVAAALAQLDK